MFIGDPANPEAAMRSLANPSWRGHLDLNEASTWARLCGFGPSTAVVRRSLFERHGLFDLSLFYTQDWELMLRFWLAGEEAAMVDEPMGWSVVRPGQISQNVWGVFAERQRFIRRAIEGEHCRPGFRKEAEAALRAQEADAAQVVLGAALDQAETSIEALRRESRWAMKHHLRKMPRLKAWACAVAPGTALAIRRANAVIRGSAAKPARSNEKSPDEFPLDDRVLPDAARQLLAGGSDSALGEMKIPEVWMDDLGHQPAGEESAAG
jgi:hypothetical protein